MRAVAETAVEIVGLAAIVAGVLVNWGLGWALIVGGVLTVGVSVWRVLR